MTDKPATRASDVRLALLDLIPEPDVPGGKVMRAKLLFEAYVTAVDADAARYRWLRDTLHAAAAGGAVYVNEERVYYREPIPGKAVELRWYPNTPVGFNSLEGDTLDAVVDAGMRDSRGL